MKVENEKVVSFFYSLKEADGEQLETSEQGIPMTYLHGYNNILAGLEDAMEGLSEGETKTIVLPPEEAYGPRKEDSTQRVPIKHLVGKPKRLQKGLLVKVNTAQGTVNGRIIKVGKFNIDVDMNHPFAGKTLQFDVEVQEIRDATPEEISHGHAHGPGGHHH